MPCDATFYKKPKRRSFGKKKDPSVFSQVCGVKTNTINQRADVKMKWILLNSFTVKKRRSYVGVRNTASIIRY